MYCTPLIDISKRFDVSSHEDANWFDYVYSFTVQYVQPDVQAFAKLAL